MVKALAPLLAFCTVFASSPDFSPEVRYGVGISDFRGHGPFQSLSFGPNIIKIYPALSVSIGAVFAFKINENYTFAPELQYTLYKAHGEAYMENGTSFRTLNEAGVEMHSIEIPMMAHFNFGSAYIEAGPQIGANVHAKIYLNHELRKPDMNIFAFGPSVGFGARLKYFSIGLRHHFGLFEYAERTNGYPWAMQISLTSM
jgi:hypothetical protein